MAAVEARSPNPPSTLDQLIDIANRPATSTSASAWGPPSLTTAVPSALQRAADENEPTAMTVVKNVAVPSALQIETLVPREHFQLATSVPFVKPAEIAAALIAAGLLTREEWTKTIHYTYESNFTHFISVPQSKNALFEQKELSGEEVRGSKTTRTGTESFTLTIMKPGRSAASATLRNVPVGVTKETLTGIFDLVDGVKLMSANRLERSPDKWAVRLQGPGVQDLHHIRCRNLIRSAPSERVDILVLIPGRRIACKRCGSQDHPHWKCPERNNQRQARRPRREEEVIDEELRRMENERQRELLTGGRRHPELEEALEADAEKEGEEEDTEDDGEGAESETSHKGGRNKQRKRGKGNPRKKKNKSKKGRKDRSQESETESETEFESSTEDAPASSDPLVSRTQALATVQAMAAEIPLERLSEAAKSALGTPQPPLTCQYLLEEEEPSEPASLQADDYSRHELGDQPLTNVDVEREGNKEGEETGQSATVLYHPSIPLESLSPLTGGPTRPLSASTPVGKAGGAASENGARLEDFSTPTGPESNFQGRKTSFVHGQSPKPGRPKKNKSPLGWLTSKVQTRGSSKKSGTPERPQPASSSPSKALQIQPLV